MTMSRDEIGVARALARAGEQFFIDKLAKAGIPIDPKSGGAPIAVAPVQPLGSQVGETAAPQDESSAPDTNVLDWLK